MYTSNYFSNLLQHIILCQLHELETALSDNTALPKLTSEDIENIEKHSDVLISVLPKINDCKVNDFEENERIYIRHAIASYLHSLADLLLINEIAPKENYDVHCDTIHATLLLYQFFL
ncbi:MAG: hypothetical protein E7396_09845 [Ruminococcaceae bacterium]|nr:hypothetical protein [Oscillospiraceae bacterium]